MATELYAITAANVLDELNPLDLEGLIQLDVPGGVASAVVDGHANRAESTVVSSIPEVYRRMHREIVGEILTEEAEADQDEFQLTLYPVVSGTLRLFKDFPCMDTKGGLGSLNVGVQPFNSAGHGTVDAYGRSGRQPYSSRTYRDRVPSTDYSVNTSTGLITFTTGLTQGARLFADYQHTGMSLCYSLRALALQLAAASFGRTLPGIGQEGIEFLQRMEDRATAALLAIMDGRAGVDLLDKIKLVENETRSENASRGNAFNLFM